VFRFFSAAVPGLQTATVKARTGEEAEKRLHERYPCPRCVTLIQAEEKKWLDLKTGNILVDEDIHDN
jgi:hypothetical protein